MHALYGFLVATFVAHSVAFLILAIRRKKKYYFLLTGTFFFLTVLYILKFNSLVLHVPGSGLTSTVVLRVLAIVCTASYLAVIARTPGTWFSRLLGRG